MQHLHSSYLDIKRSKVIPWNNVEFFDLSNLIVLNQMYIYESKNSAKLGTKENILTIDRNKKMLLFLHFFFSYHKKKRNEPERKILGS